MGLAVRLGIEPREGFPQVIKPPGVSPLPDFDPHSPLARGLLTPWFRRSGLLLRIYGEEGAWGDAWEEVGPPPKPDSWGLGACRPFNIADNRGWRLRLTPHRLTLRWAGRWKGRAGRPPEHTGERRSLAGSLRRMTEATRALEAAGIRPTHLLTLTLPPDVWERLPSDAERIARWRGAHRKFLGALAKRLRRGGYSPAWFWWVEFQGARKAPHLHLLLDLGGRLPDEEFRGWTAWLTAEWGRALGVPAPYATRIEALRKAGPDGRGDFRYARAYAAKPRQKELPFPGPWGRTWGVGGPWRELLRDVRSAPASSWVLGDAEVVAVLLEVAHQAERAGLLGVHEFRAAFSGVLATAQARLSSEPEAPPGSWRAGWWFPSPREEWADAVAVAVDVVRYGEKDPAKMEAENGGSFSGGFRRGRQGGERRPPASERAKNVANRGGGRLGRREGGGAP